MKRGERAGGTSGRGGTAAAEDHDGRVDESGRTHGSAPAFSTPKSSAVTTASGSSARTRSDFTATGTTAASSGTAHAVPSSLIPPQSA